MTATIDRVRQLLNDRYQVEAEIGRGGMAVVYSARDHRHERDVAIKVLQSSPDAPVDPARFAREIRIAAGLSHPGIVPVFDSGHADDLLYYVMPLVRGASLRARLDRAPRLTNAETCRLLAEVADALAAAHDAGVVHRDVKPENILITHDHAVVTDFGIARIVGDARESLTQTGAIIGTVLYMSPEQLEAGGSVDGRADLFALGCILFEILSGKPPYDAPTFPQTLARLATESAPDLPGTVQVSPALRQVVVKALERNPARRYQTARELADALRDAVIDAGAASRRVARVRAGRLVGGAVATLVLAAVAGLALYHAHGAKPASVAVLPFVNASDDTSLEYLSDGVTEEMQSALGNAGIAVASRDASFAWKRRTPTPQQIADSLHVTEVIEGSVRQTADSLRITVRLIDGHTMLQLKSYSVTRKRSDVFALQEEVARALVAALKPTLAGIPDTLVRNRTDNLTAYDLTLRATYISSSGAAGGGAGSAAFAGSSAASALAALALADSAIALDSGYAPAWARRAIVLQNQAIFGDVRDIDHLRLARDAAARAIALDDRDAESQVAYGLLLFRYEWNWAQAENHLRRAIELNPRLFAAHSAYARFLRSMGRFDQSRAELAAAYAIEPSAAREHFAEARISYFAHDYARGLRETAAGADTSSRTYATWTGQLYLAAGRLADAESLLTHTRHPAPGAASTLELLYARTARPALARRLMDSTESGAPDSQDAEVMMALGDTTRALDILEESIRTRNALVVDMKVDPLLDPLRSKPRFQAMMRKLAFP